MHTHAYIDGCKQNHQVTWMNANEIVRIEHMTHTHSERDRNKFTDMYIKRLMSIHRPFGHPNLHRKDGSWQKDNMTWTTTITTPRKRTKSMKRHVQITNSLPSRPQCRPSFSLSWQMFASVRVWVFVLFGRSLTHSLCDGNDCVWIVRDVESDVLVLWFDSIKANIDGKYYVKYIGIVQIYTYVQHSFAQRNREIVMLRLRLRLLLHKIKRSTACKNKRKNWQKQQSKKFRMCVSMWQELIRIAVCVSLLLVHKYVHRSPWLILGFVLLFISPN